MWNYEKYGCIYETGQLTVLVTSVVEKIQIEFILVQNHCPGVREMNGKRPDGITHVPWINRKNLVWHFTCVDTIATS